MRIRYWSSDVCSSGVGFSAFCTVAANVATLGPVGQEVLDAFELGAKNRFFDRRLSVNTALFYYRYEGKQAGLSVYDGFVASYNSTKAGDARLYGIEAELELQASERRDFHVSGLLFDPGSPATDAITKIGKPH